MEQQEPRGTAIALYVPSTGETFALALASARPEELADVYEGIIPTIRRDLADAERRVGDELVRRSDLALTGTRRYGEPEDGVQFEVVVPSEAAGADDYDVDKVDEGVVQMVADGHLSQEGADAVLERTVTVTYRVSTDEQADALMADARADPRFVRTSKSRAVRKAGMNALEKRAVAAPYIEPARKPKDPPRRRPTIKRIERKAVRS